MEAFWPCIYSLPFCFFNFFKGGCVVSQCSQINNRIVESSWRACPQKDVGFNRENVMRLKNSRANDRSQRILDSAAHFEISKIQNEIYGLRYVARKSLKARPSINQVKPLPINRLLAGEESVTRQALAFRHLFVNKIRKLSKNPQNAAQAAREKEEGRGLGQRRALHQGSLHDLHRAHVRVPHFPDEGRRVLRLPAASVSGAQVPAGEEQVRSRPAPGWGLRDWLLAERPHIRPPDLVGPGARSSAPGQVPTRLRVHRAGGTESPQEILSRQGGGRQ